LGDHGYRNEDGIVASKLIKCYHPEARIIILSQHDDPAYRELAKLTGVEK